MSLSLAKGSTDRSGRAATKEPCDFNYDDCTLRTLLPCPQFAWVHACFGEKVARDETTRWRIRATADVPILWTHNPAPQTILPGMRPGSQTSLGVVAERTTKMPFSENCHSFDSPTLSVINDDGSVYGLFKSDLPFRPNHYTCLFVGQTNDLRARLLEHYNNPSIDGVTHFFAEASATEQQRKLREQELIAEFNPPGNKTSRGC
jgi:hypothetical protein